MSSTLSVCRRAIQCHSTLSSEHIWVSDEYLTSLLRQFALSRSSKRHGSSIPGPLEAKRRLAKRRLTSVSMGPAGGSIDAALWLGIGEESARKSWRWEPPTLRETYQERYSSVKEDTPSLPSWLGDIDPSPTNEEPTIQADSGSTKSKLTSFDTVPNDVDSVSHSKIENLVEGVITGAVKTSYSMADSTNVSQDWSRFKHLLDSQSSLSTILTFLDDPSMNVSRGRNLKELLQWLVSHQETYDIANLGMWIRKHVSLGMLSEHEIRSILRLEAVTAELGKCHNWNVPEKVWDGLQSSSVLDAKNLETATIRSLLKTSEYLSFGDRLSLGLAIINALPPLQLKQTQSALSSFLQFIILAEPKLLCSKLKGPSYRTMLAELCGSFLGTLPKDVSLQCIVDTTKELMKVYRRTDVSASQERGSALETWISILSRSKLFLDVRERSSWRGVEYSMSMLDTNAIGAYLRHCRNDQIEHFILRYWVPQDIQRRVWPSVTALQYRRQLNCRGQEINMDAIKTYLQTLQTVSQNPSLFQSLLDRLIPLLRYLKQSEIMLHLIRYAQQSENNVYINIDFIVWAIDEQSRTNPILALKVFASDSRALLDDCPGLAPSVVAHHKIDANSTLRFLLRRGQDTSFSYEERKKKVILKPPKRISILHDTAVAFANALHMRPRESFRGVVYCYHCLLRSHSTLKPKMSQALTEAGVNRYLRAGQWVGSRKLRWILYLVKEIEGEEVAKKLDHIVYIWRDAVVQETSRQRKLEQASKHNVVLYQPICSVADIHKPDKISDL